MRIGVGRGNWIQIVSGKGWFTIPRLYSPLGCGDGARFGIVCFFNP